MPIIDSHIHIDLYKKSERMMIVEQMKKYKIEALIAVSNDLTSAKKVQSLANTYDTIKPAYGYHPEQPLPTDSEWEKLVNFIEVNQEKLVAIGEVGLPYYKRKKKVSIKMDAYIEMLESFIIIAKRLCKPIVLHTVYEDAQIACHLLEKHSIKKAHFHWFKGDPTTIERMILNNYYISVTPDILYEERTRELVRSYPLELIMVETDGPWKFSGPFRNELTHPKMIHLSIREIANIKQLSVREVYEEISMSTKQFYL